MSTRPMALWMVISTVFSGVAGLMSLLFVLFIPMMFDAPGSEQNRALIALACCVALFPEAAAAGPDATGTDRVPDPGSEASHRV